MSKKLNIIEAMKMPIGTEFNIEIGKTENTPGFTFTKIAIKLFGQTKAFYNLETDKPLSLFEEYLNTTFIPIQQSVSFMEAMKSYYIGKNIRCEYEGNSCFYNTGIILVDSKGRPILTKEILEGKWYIEESEELEDERLSEQH